MASINECVEALDNLEEWTKPIKPHKPLMFAMDTAEIRHEPLGVVLIIGPWNYPINLILIPIISAIAAGNCVVIKPSEVASNTAKLLTEVLPTILDPSAFAVVNGGVPETTALLKEQFDHIFYTGNGHVGKIVMTAAAKHLTPVTLELGGKCPVYVHGDMDAVNVAKRVLWAKQTNAGQTCIAPDYILVKKSAAPALYEGFKKAQAIFYGPEKDAARQCSAFSRVVNIHHWNRLNKILERQLEIPRSQVVIGGSKDSSELYIAPTVISGVQPGDPIMEDELFGPMMGVIEVEDENEAIAYINSRDRPLALYVFTSTPRIAEKV
ncbi:Aldehyde dehydrogenase, partial [Chytridiales sp. JEL 0842]